MQSQTIILSSIIVTLLCILLVLCKLLRDKAIPSSTKGKMEKKPKFNMLKGLKNYGVTSDFKVYGYMGCPYTVKQLDLMKASGVSYTFVPTDTDKGSEEFTSLMKGEQSGVPVTLNNSSGKISKGFTELSEL